jgi:hypothetical protein
MVCIFNPACELLPPWTKELYLCTVAPMPSVSPPTPFPKQNVQYIQTVCGCGGGRGGGGGGVYFFLEQYLGEF